MERFVREGTFRDRGRFLQVLRGTLARLREGALRGMDETWERTGEADVARLSGLGVRAELAVGASSWRAVVEIPAWFPISREAVEAKFDEMAAAWKDL